MAQVGDIRQGSSVISGSLPAPDVVGQVLGEELNFSRVTDHTLCHFYPTSISAVHPIPLQYIRLWLAGFSFDERHEYRWDSGELSTPFSFLPSQSLSDHAQRLLQPYPPTNFLFSYLPRAQQPDSGTEPSIRW